MKVHFICNRYALLLALLLAGSVSLHAAPKTLPREVARHFCQLLVNDGEGRIYPLSMYANHLTMLLYDGTEYDGLTAEQVLTGLIFYYDDWISLPASSREALTLAQELHTGQTLRVFPHLSEGQVTWFAPTDPLPESIGPEHRKYMQELFSRLNGEVQEGNWQAVDAYVDKMIEYQCKFGGSKPAKAAVPSHLVWMIALFLMILPVSRLFFVPLSPKRTKQ